MPVLPCLGGDGRGAHGVGWPAVSPPWGLSMESVLAAVKRFSDTEHAPEAQVHSLLALHVAEVVMAVHFAELY